MTVAIVVGLLAVLAAYLEVRRRRAELPWKPAPPVPAYRYRPGMEKADQAIFDRIGKERLDAYLAAYDRLGKAQAAPVDGKGRPRVASFSGRQGGGLPHERRGGR